MTLRACVTWDSFLAPGCLGREGSCPAPRGPSGRGLLLLRAGSRLLGLPAGGTPSSHLSRGEGCRTAGPACGRSPGCTQAGALGPRPFWVSLLLLL